MKNSFVSQILIGLLLIAIPIQNLYAIDDTSVVPTKQGSIAQLKETMKHFSRAARSFVRCAATGECKTEHQKKLAAEIGGLAKRLVMLIGTVAVIGTAAWFTRRKVIKDLKELKAEFKDIEADVESRTDAALAKYKPIIEESVNKAVMQSVDYAKAAVKAEIQETLNDAEKRIKDAVERTEVVVPSVVKGGKAQVVVKPPTDAAQPNQQSNQQQSPGWFGW